MLHKIVVSDGTVIGSDKIMSTSFTTTSVDGQDVEPGAACTSELEVTIWGEAGSETIREGTSFEFFDISDQGDAVLKATLIANKPTRSSANTYKVIAYDTVAKSDKDMTAYINGIADSFPMTLYQLIEGICIECGLTLSGNTLRNSYYVVQSNRNLLGYTGRQLLQWAGQVCGQFIKAAPNGDITFSWYSENTSISIASTKSATEVPFYSGSLSYEDYVVSPVEKVQIRQSQNDVGVVAPPGKESGNTYIIESNGMFVGDSADNISEIAISLLDVMSSVSYTPMTVEIPYTSGIGVGDIISVRDSNGVTISAYITKCVDNGQTMSLESVGNPRRDSVSAINAKQFQNQQGRVFELSVSVDGLKTKAEDLDGKYSQLEQTAGQVSVKVGTEKGTLSTIIDPTTWEAKLVTSDGDVLSGISFDFEKGQFLFNGAGKFTGSINVNDKFKVFENGDVEARGNTVLYGGKYYAMDSDGIGGWTEMAKDGFVMYSKSGKQLVKIGFPSEYTEYPYIWLDASSSDAEESGMFKRFSDGIWLGNSKPVNANGKFYAKEGYNGIFISFTENKAYVVQGTTMQNLYTGETIARFG